MTLKELRKLHKLTQTEMADRVNVTRVTIARIETGTRKASPELVNRVMKEFNLSVEEVWDMFYSVR